MENTELFCGGDEKTLGPEGLEGKDGMEPRFSEFAKPNGFGAFSVVFGPKLKPAFAPSTLPPTPNALAFPPNAKPGFSFTPPTG